MVHKASDPLDRPYGDNSSLLFGIGRDASPQMNHAVRDGRTDRAGGQSGLFAQPCQYSEAQRAIPGRSLILGSHSDGVQEVGPANNSYDPPILHDRHALDLVLLQDEPLCPIAAFPARP